MGWIALSVLWVLLGLASIFPALMTPMLFDAPGSTSNRFTVGIAIAIIAFPVASLFGAVLPWVFRGHRFAKVFFLMPVLNLAVIVILFCCVQYFHGGMLGGAGRSD